jgi:hypothetical protein
VSVGANAKKLAQNLNHPADMDPELGRIVLQELDRILESRYFKNSQRSRQFLEYIVHRMLEGRSEDLKERTIGTALFQRAPDYLTGEDPVVRVQAGEVRRRLEQFYQTDTGQAPVRIELTAGSYAPHFHLRGTEPIGNPEEVRQSQSAIAADAAKPRPGMRTLTIASLFVVVAIAAAVIWVGTHNKAHQISVAEQFWAPALASQQPVMICLAKPVVYRPSLELYRRYSTEHPESFGTEVERSNRVLPLAPQTQLTWNEMVPYSDYGVAVGDVEAAVSISALLGKIGKPTQVRIGNQYSYQDLHDAPSAVIGAFNNRWTMQITPGLHFKFVEENGAYSIRENFPGGRIWVPKSDKFQQTEQDFAIVARLLDSNTGQFTIVAAGILGSGTQAAGEFVSRPDMLEKAVRMLPAGWQNKSVEFVLQTNITDSVAGPPSVVAYYIW